MPEKKSTFELNMPYSLEAEQAVLGAVLVEPESINAVMSDSLKAEHFYLPEHQAIYTVMCTKAMDGQLIDFVTVLEALKSENFFAGEQGKAYLLKLAQMVPSISNISNYARIIKEKADVRSLIRISREIIEDAMDPSVDAAMLVDAAEQKIFDIRQERNTKGLELIKYVLAGNHETFQKLASDDRGDYVGIPTGISTLDAVTSGLNKSDLIIVGARPGMGKTSFVLNIARNIAIQQHKTVAFFNLEMSKEQMVNRLLSAEARGESTKLRTGNLTTDEWTRIGYASGVLCEAPIYLDDTATITVQEMQARLRRLKRVDAVFIDYLQLMHSARRIDNRVQEVTEITRSLKIMAKELNVPVIVCAQLSRDSEKQGGSHIPNLSDLRESGSIEQDADQVLFLYREAYYMNEKADPTAVNTNSAKVIVAKNRHGELRNVDLAWQGEFTQFTALELHKSEG